MSLGPIPLEEVQQFQSNDSMLVGCIGVVAALLGLWMVPQRQQTATSDRIPQDVYILSLHPHGKLAKIDSTPLPPRKHYIHRNALVESVSAVTEHTACE